MNEIVLGVLAGLAIVGVIGIALFITAIKNMGDGEG